MCWEVKGIDEILKYAKYLSDWVEIKKKGDDKITLVQTVSQPSNNRGGNAVHIKEERHTEIHNLLFISSIFKVLTCVL